MAQEKPNEQRDYREVLGEKNYGEVIKRIKDLTEFVQELLNDSLAEVDLIARTFLTRRFLFDEDHYFPSPILDSRQVSAYWELSQGKMEFPLHFLVRYLYEQLNDTVKVVTPFLKSLDLNPIQIKRFAALIYSAMLLIHVYVNGNKRTSHSVAFSYMYELDPELVSDYFPYLALHITNYDDYFGGNLSPRQRITQILFMVTSPEFIGHWLGYTITGEFKPVGRSVIHPDEAAIPNYSDLISMWQNTLDGITEQIMQNMQKSIDEIAETISDSHSQVELPQTQLANYQES